MLHILSEMKNRNKRNKTDLAGYLIIDPTHTINFIIHPNPANHSSRIQNLFYRNANVCIFVASLLVYLFGFRHEIFMCHIEI